MPVAVLVCGKVGVPDIDRFNALCALGWDVVAYELDRTTEYVWDEAVRPHFAVRKTTAEDMGSYFRDVFRADILVIYGYNKPLAFISSLLRWLVGAPAISINDSKFDDYERSIFADLIKCVLLAPYRGFMVASVRAGSYLRYLGCRQPMAIYHCAIDIDRVRAAAAPSASSTFEARHFVMVGRFIQKKNYETALAAFERYRAGGGQRSLVICGYGEQEGALRSRISKSQHLSTAVRIIKEATVEQVGEALSASIALLLPSVEEQFGIVVTEAQAAGVPVIVSDNCGACDIFSNGLGGFKVEANNVDGLELFMRLLSSDETFWRTQSTASLDNSKRAGLDVFLNALGEITGTKVRSERYACQ